MSFREDREEAKQMKKRIVSLMICVALFVAVVGCAKPETAAGNAQLESAQESTEQSGADAAKDVADTDGAGVANDAAQDAGAGVVFETKTLSGSTVKSEDIFSAHKLTMVNLWGTYCGPCIREMPDLEVLNQRLGEKDCAIIGIVIDVQGIEDGAMVLTAGKILADTGVTYQNLLPWAGFTEVFPANFVPTTYFVDREGRIVGEAAIGARGADEYEALLDEVLATLPDGK